MSDSIDKLIHTVIDGRDLSRDETAQVFDELMAGRLSDRRIEQYLTALADKGETVEEIVGAATVMRRHVTQIDCDELNAIDTCGTGGDGISTFNVSTAAAIVAAGAGAKVAKHGNRSNSRRSGSAEVLQALGVNVDASPESVARCIKEVGIGFLFAAKLHPAMRHVVPIRRKIGRPTIFNLLGPLTNPAFVTRQIVGVPRLELTRKIADVLQQLGDVHAFVVHGHDGLCDFTITGPSHYVELRMGRLEEKTVQPEEAGLEPGSIESLRIASPAESAAVIRSILRGEPGPCRDHTLLNVAFALMVAGIAEDLPNGIRRAANSIDSGAAAETLKRLVALTEAGGIGPVGSGGK
ncbi:MAG: anthranilate phosphoribosyltransferase [Phycisphaerales bacterium]|nr:anthranilate phosphoribosyltransferase [Phycisphaerales bacterium]